jgi:hypothetical protein
MTKTIGKNEVLNVIRDFSEKIISEVVPNEAINLAFNFDNFY